MRLLQVAYSILATFWTRQAIFKAFDFESSVFTTASYQLNQIEPRSCLDIGIITIK